MKPFAVIVSFGRLHLSLVLRDRASVPVPARSSRSEWPDTGGCRIQTGGRAVWGQRSTHTHCCCRVFVTVEDIRTTVLLPNKWSCTDLQEDFPGTRTDAQTFGLNALL